MKFLRYNFRSVFSIGRARQAVCDRQYANRALWPFYALLVLIAMLGVFLYMLSPAPGFPTYRTIEVEKGSSLSDVSALLKEQHVVRSELAFELFAILFAGDSGAKAGVYFFDEPLSTVSVAHRITEGIFGLTNIKVTIPEGSSVFDTAEILESEIPDFDSVEFVKRAQSHEGYLFPETYFFLPTVEPREVIAAMRRVFEDKMEEISDVVEASPYTRKEIIIMASILEEEAITFEDKRMISGLLWKRIEIGMPLQVDAVFLYINGKNTYELTHEDLAHESLYNTYRYQGLPPGPITNPGLDSIIAAANPEPSPYLFYLSDRQYNVYYAEDFEEHKRNKQKYVY